MIQKIVDITNKTLPKFKRQKYKVSFLNQEQTQNLMQLMLRNKKGLYLQICKRKQRHLWMPNHLKIRILMLKSVQIEFKEQIEGVTLLKRHQISIISKITTELL